MSAARERGRERKTIVVIRFRVYLSKKYLLVKVIQPERFFLSAVWAWT